MSFRNLRDTRTPLQRAQFQWFSQMGTIARTRSNLEGMMSLHSAWFSTEQFRVADLILKRLYHAVESDWETAKALHPVKRKTRRNK